MTNLRDSEENQSKTNQSSRQRGLLSREELHNYCMQTLVPTTKSRSVACTRGRSPASPVFLHPGVALLAISRRSSGKRGAPERQRKSLVMASAKLGAAMRMAMEQTMWKRAKSTRQSRSMTAPANFHWLQVALEMSWLRKR